MLFIRCPKLLDDNGGTIVKIRINAKNFGAYSNSDDIANFFFLCTFMYFAVFILFSLTYIFDI